MTPPRPSDTGFDQDAGMPAAVLSCADEPAQGAALPTAGSAPGSPDLAPPTAGTVPLETLRQRADFLRAAQGRKAGTGGFLLQGRARGDAAGPRIGFTASKKVGNAVFRNRAKRRLRALAREILAPEARMGWDYVLVAKPGATVDRAWSLLQDDLREAIARVHK